MLFYKFVCATRRGFIENNIMLLVASTCSKDKITLQKFMLLLDFTKFLKCDNRDILNLWMLGQYKRQHVPKPRYSAHAPKIDLSPTFQKITQTWQFL